MPLGIGWGGRWGRGDESRVPQLVVEQLVLSGKALPALARERLVRPVAQGVAHHMVLLARFVRAERAEVHPLVVPRLAVIRDLVMCAHRLWRY